MKITMPCGKCAAAVEIECPPAGEAFTVLCLPCVATLQQSSLKEEIERLRAAIIKHRSQKADDRCVEDDDELYAALGDGIKCDRRVGDKFQMLRNCARFIEQRCTGGGWLSYAELETRWNEAYEEISAAHKALDEFGIKRAYPSEREFPVANRIRLLALGRHE
jgi:hypothetical protein